MSKASRTIREGKIGGAADFSRRMGTTISHLHDCHLSRFPKKVVGGYGGCNPQLTLPAPDKLSEVPTNPLHGRSCASKNSVDEQRSRHTVCGTASNVAAAEREGGMARWVESAGEKPMT